MRILSIGLAVIASIVFTSVPANTQMYPPGTFSVDGFPVMCGTNVFILNPGLPDAGMNTGTGQIILNPTILNQLPTPVKLYVVAHECGHSVVGADEVAADCWAIRIGKQQGWFPPQAFQLLMQFFQSNPGSMRHPPGPQRVANMWQCYNQF